MASYKELLAQKQELERKMEETRKAEVSEVVARIKEAIQVYGLKPADLYSKQDLNGVPSTRTSSLKGTSVAPKYRDPETGKTWSGRGRMPGWLTPETAEQFLMA